MGFLDGIEKVRNRDFNFLLLAVLLLFSPGVGYIFYFSKDLFISLEIFKLLVLSLSIITPFFIVFFIFLAAMFDADKEEPLDKDSLVFASFISGILFSSITLYIGLGFAIFTHSNMLDALLCSFVTEIILAATIYFSEKQKVTN